MDPLGSRAAASNFRRRDGKDYRISGSKLVLDPLPCSLARPKPQNGPQLTLGFAGNQGIQSLRNPHVVFPSSLLIPSNKSQAARLIALRTIVENEAGGLELLM